MTIKKIKKTKPTTVRYGKLELNCAHVSKMNLSEFKSQFGGRIADDVEKVFVECGGAITPKRSEKTGK